MCFVQRCIFVIQNSVFDRLIEPFISDDRENVKSCPNDSIFPKMGGVWVLIVSYSCSLLKPPKMGYFASLGQFFDIIYYESIIIKKSLKI